MSHLKNTINGITGVTTAAATIVTQMTEHIEPLIKLAAGIGGLIVIGLTIVVSFKTAKRTDLERKKLTEEIAELESHRNSVDPPDERP